jgi:hypothetical protein
LTPTSLAVFLNIFPRSRLLLKNSSNRSSFVSKLLKSINTSELLRVRCLQMHAINFKIIGSNCLSLWYLKVSDPKVSSFSKNSLQKDV